jgi:hypothetical protein
MIVTAAAAVVTTMRHACVHGSLARVPAACVAHLSTHIDAWPPATTMRQTRARARAHPCPCLRVRPLICPHTCVACFSTASPQPIPLPPCSIAGKGDGNIRHYEYENDGLYALGEHRSSDPQRRICFLPRRSVNTSECEIACACKPTLNVIEPIAFIVPRKVSFTSQRPHRND